MSNATGAGSTGGDGFFSNIGKSFAEGLSTIGKDILPVWAADQLRKRSERDTGRPTFDAKQAQPRNDDGIETTSGPARTGTVGNALGFDVGGLTLSPAMLLAIVAAVGVGVWAVVTVSSSR